MKNNRVHNLNTEDFFEIGIETNFNNDLYSNLENRHSLDGFIVFNQLKLKTYSMYQTTTDKIKNRIFFEKIEEIQKKASQKFIELIEDFEKKPNLPFSFTILKFENFFFNETNKNNDLNNNLNILNNLNNNSYNNFNNSLNDWNNLNVPTAVAHIV
jgi:hypothetical protein